MKVSSEADEGIFVFLHHFADKFVKERGTGGGTRLMVVVVLFAIAEITDRFYPQGILAEGMGSEIEGKAFHVECLELAVFIFQPVHDGLGGHDKRTTDGAGYEGFGLVLLEAMTCGLPCISFDCPDGPREIITDRHDGLLVPYHGHTDAERSAAFSEALCRMIEDHDMRIRMSKEAISKARDFSRDAIMNQWLMLFNTLTEK